jgi:hypothetical protein
VAPRAACAEVYSGDLLLALPLSRAIMSSKNGAVQLQCWGNLPEISPFPIMESAVILHAPRAADLDFTLQRGRVIVSNHKKRGPAQVRIRLPQAVWDLTLTEPRSQVALELFGRWPRGVPFVRDPGPADAPTRDVVLLMLEGSAQLRSRGQEHALRAPPGPAYFHGDSVAGDDPAPQRRDGPPSWMAGESLHTPEARLALGVVEEMVQRCRDSVHPEEVVKVLVQQAGTEQDRRRARSLYQAAVYSMGALDLLDSLSGALGSRNAAMRDEAVPVLRHWIGRGPGQDQILFDFLHKTQKYSAAHAEIVLQLLHSYGSDDLQKPETYETLIAYLRHPRLTIRQLAGWHLSRLVPAGKAIPYDPAGPEKDIERAHAAWKKLVPTGKLPPTK